jgi:large subunit ribosomal protein L15
MYLHDLKPSKGSKTKRKIIGRGRGSGHGKTSTRGHKGAMSRSGHWVVGASEGGQMRLIRRLPKVGFRSKRPILNQVVHIEDLNRFDNGAVVTAELLKTKGLISSLNKPFKILGDGTLKKAVTVQVVSISKSAEEKIKKAGGKVEIIDNTITEETQGTKK